MFDVLSAGVYILSDALTVCKFSLIFDWKLQLIRRNLILVMISNRSFSNAASFLTGGGQLCVFSPYVLLPSTSSSSSSALKNIAFHRIFFYHRFNFFYQLHLISSFRWNWNVFHAISKVKSFHGCNEQFYRVHNERANVPTCIKPVS